MCLWKLYLRETRRSSRVSVPALTTDLVQMCKVWSEGREVYPEGRVLR